MPLPKPKKGEKEKAFIDRCMADKNANKEFPKDKNRAGYCYGAWNRSKKKKKQERGMDKEIRLTAAKQDGALAVDRDNSVIKNVSIITKGLANPGFGEVFEVDDVMLKQVTDSINEKKGVKSRVTHPFEDGVLSLIGTVQDARLEKDRVRGDIHIKSYAEVSPAGNMKEYLLRLAEEDPKNAGLSIVFMPAEYERDEDNPTDPPVGRIQYVTAADIVGDPAANTSGFLSAKDKNNKTVKPKTRKDFKMNEKLRKYLESLGLDTDADDAAAIEYYEGLEGDQKDIAEALFEKSEDKPEPEDKPDEDESEDESDDGLSARDEGIKLERDRHMALVSLAKKHSMPDDFVERHMKLGTDVKTAEAFAQELEKMSKDFKERDISVGDDRNLSTLSDAVTDAILVKARVPLYETDRNGVPKRDAEGKLKRREAHKRAASFQDMRLVAMGRNFLKGIGAPGVDAMGDAQIAECLFDRSKFRRAFGSIALAQSTSDFDYVLQDAINKSLAAAYVESEKTWPQWVRRVSASDFKTNHLTKLSEAPDMSAIDEGEEVSYGTLTDSEETYTLSRYAMGIALTWKSFINDDMSAFQRIPELQANAVVRQEDDAVYELLLANGAMSEDSVALFHASHSNLGTGGGPTVARLNTARAAMRKQKGLASKARLNIKPAHILIPPEYEGTVDELLNSTFRPDDSKGHIKNIWAGKLNPIVEPRLSDSAVSGYSTTAWYLIANYNQIDTFVISFLQGYESPQLSSKEDFETLDKKYVVRQNIGVCKADWRGMYKNTGA